MDLEKEFGVDEELVEQGAKIEVGEDDAYVIVAAIPNDNWDRFLDPHRRRARRMGKELPESIAEEAMAKHVLLGWGKMTDGTEEIEPSAENRLAMIRKYPSFKRLILQLATDEANFRREREEAAKKNSRSGSSGTSGSAH